MAVSTRIGYRAKPQDEEILLKLAEELEFDISDTLRFAVRHTARSYGLLPAKNHPVETSSIIPMRKGNDHHAPKTQDPT